MVKKGKTIKVTKYAKGSKSNLKIDKKRKALKPGKRKSATGSIYWETRRNRSDL